MKLLTAIGKESTLSFGYMVDKKDSDLKCVSIVFFEVIWNSRTRKFGIGIGIPFVAALGFFFVKSSSIFPLRDF